MLCRITVLLIVVVTSFHSSVVNATPIPTDLTAQDVNTLIALEATQEALVLAAFHINQPYVNDQSLGSWSGMINSDGWSLSFTGSLNGIPLSMTQSGDLDLPGGQATWTTSGSFGSEPFDGSGTIALDPSWTEVLFGAAVIGVQALSATTAVGIVAGALVSSVIIHGESELEQAGEDLQGKIEKKVGQATTASSEARFHASSFVPSSLTNVRFWQTGSQDPSTGLTTLQAQSETVPSQIPTLSEWGVISLILVLLILVGIYTVRRRDLTA